MQPARLVLAAILTFALTPRVHGGDDTRWFVIDDAIINSSIGGPRERPPGVSEVIVDYRRNADAIVNAKETVGEWSVSVGLMRFGVDDPGYRVRTMGAWDAAERIAPRELRLLEKEFYTNLEAAGVSGQDVAQLGHSVRRSRIMNMTALRRNLPALGTPIPDGAVRSLDQIVRRSIPGAEETAEVASVLVEYRSQIDSILRELEVKLFNHLDAMVPRRREAAARARQGLLTPSEEDAFLDDYIRPYRLLHDLHEIRQRFLNELRPIADPGDWHHVQLATHGHLLPVEPISIRIERLLGSERNDSPGALKEDLAALLSDARTLENAAIADLARHYERFIEPSVVRDVSRRFLHRDEDISESMDRLAAELAERQARWGKRFEGLQARLKELVGEAELQAAQPQEIVDARQDDDAAPARVVQAPDAVPLPQPASTDINWPLSLSRSEFNHVLSETGLKDQPKAVILEALYDDYRAAIREAEGDLDALDHDDVASILRLQAKMLGALPGMLRRFIDDGAAVLDGPMRVRWMEGMQGAVRRIALRDLSEWTGMRLTEAIVISDPGSVTPETRRRLEAINAEYIEAIDRVVEQWLTEGTMHHARMRLLSAMQANAPDREANDERIKSFRAMQAIHVNAIALQNRLAEQIAQLPANGIELRRVYDVNRDQFPLEYTPSPIEVFVATVERHSNIIELRDAIDGTAGLWQTRDALLRSDLVRELRRLSEPGRGGKTERAIALIRRRVELTFSTAQRLRRVFPPEDWDSLPGAARVLLESLLDPDA